MGDTHPIEKKPANECSNGLAETTEKGPPEAFPSRLGGVKYRDRDAHTLGDVVQRNGNREAYTKRAIGDEGDVRGEL